MWLPSCRPGTVLVLALVLLGLGGVALRTLPVARWPDREEIAVSILASRPGAEPGAVEAQVAVPIEAAVSDLPGVRRVLTSVRPGAALTTVLFRHGTDAERAMSDVRGAVARVSPKLPRAVAMPLVAPAGSVGSAALYAAVAPGRTPAQLTAFLDRTLRPALRGLPGVAGVSRLGGAGRDVSVTLDPDRLAALGLTVAEVDRQLRGAMRDRSGDAAAVGGSEQPIRILPVAEDLGATSLSLPSGGRARLDDLGTVDEGTASEGLARLDGGAAVAFRVRFEPRAEEARAAVAARLGEVVAATPGLDILAVDAPPPAGLAERAGLLALPFGLVAAAVLVILVVRRSVAAALAAALSLLVATLPVFAVLHLFGQSLNLVTVAALTLSTALAVGDVMAGLDAAARRPAHHPAPVLAGLGVVIAAGFALLGLAAPVQILWPVAVTVASHALLSVWVSTMLLPVLAARLPGAASAVAPGRASRTALRVLAWPMRHRLVVVLALVVLALVVLGAGAWAGLRLPPFGALPAGFRETSRLVVELPPGASSSTLDAIAQEASRRLLALPEVARVFATDDSGPPGLESPRAVLTLSYRPEPARAGDAVALERRLARALADLPDVRFWFTDPEGVRDVALLVTGPDSGTVGNVATELAAQMGRFQTLANVIASPGFERPVLRVRPRSDVAGQLGVSSDRLADALRLAGTRDAGTAMADLEAGAEPVPIRVRLDLKVWRDPHRIEALRLPLAGVQGGVALGSIADIVLDAEPTAIFRRNGRRQAWVGADLAGTAPLGQVIDDIGQLPIMRALPPGVGITPAGAAGQIGELRDDLRGALPWVPVVAYGLLALLCGDLLGPLAILIAVPLALAGSVLALDLVGRPLDLAAAFGCLAAAILAAKAAGLLVVPATAADARAIAAAEAAKGGARPILMTALALVLGLAPAALGMEPGAVPLAGLVLAAAGGLMALPLSLLVVPALAGLGPRRPVSLPPPRPAPSDP